MVEQLYTNCLSEAAYFIESNGEAAVIDPLRDYQKYLDMAAQKGATIKYIFETHFHADFISGHLDLAKKTGAPIIYGPETVTQFPVHVAKNGERFKIGNLEIEVMHTPGHTPESTCYLLREEGNPYCIFTGDTLFVGDVGRPDLFGGVFSKEELASRMYDSLQILKQLPDEVLVYPAHGPGSACGKNLGKETWSTIGTQKKMNYALQDISRQEFIATLTEGLSAPPQYFPINAKINREGYDSLDDVLKRSLLPLSADDFEKTMKEKNVVVVDTRNENSFEEGFVPGSVFMGLNGRFAEWVGTLLNINDRILLVTDEGKEEESTVRMARVGYDHVIGFLKGGFAAWKEAGKKFDLVVTIDAEEFLLDYRNDDITVVDVRKENEYNAGHIDGSINMVLQNFNTEPKKFDDVKNHEFYVHCQMGYRSMMASSLLKRKGIHNFKNVAGGWIAISKAQIAADVPKFSES